LARSDKRRRFQPDRAQQEVDPFRDGEGLPRLHEHIQHIRLRHLDWPQSVHLERPPSRLLGDDPVVAQRHFRVEAVGQHALVVADRLVFDADIAQRKAGQLGQVAVVLRVEPGANDVDQLDRPCFLGSRLEQFLLAGAHRAILQLLLDDLQTFVDLVLVDARAVAAQEELDDVGRHRVLARVLAYEVFANQVTVEGRRREPVQRIQFHAHCPSPIVVGR
jgi:hypothetical protein